MHTIVSTKVIFCWWDLLNSFSCVTRYARYVGSVEKPSGLKQSPAKTVTHVDTVILGRDIGHSQESWPVIFGMKLCVFCCWFTKLDVSRYSNLKKKMCLEIRVEGFFDLRNYYTNTYCEITYHSPEVSGTKKLEVYALWLRKGNHTPITALQGIVQ